MKAQVRRASQRLTRVNPALARVGLQVKPIRARHEEDPIIDFPGEWRAILERVAPYTIVSPERTGGLIHAVEHVVQQGVPGAIIECGVWKGGSSMAAALTLQRLGELRELFLFDTFEGMPEPGQFDIDYNGRRETDVWDANNRSVSAGLDGVRAALASTGYPMDHVHLIKGLVEDTIPDEAPEEIAVLRLDTDWYESTRHELEHLYPRLASGGVLIVDDYGHYVGARKATDEYLPGVFLHRLDYSGRLVIKP